MWNPVIPEEEQENILSVYWQLLREVESRCGTKALPVDKCLIIGAYKVLHRCGITDTKPQFMKMDEEPSPNLHGIE